MSAERSREREVLAGKYELIRCLGRGGMGEVYEARHLELGRRVAIKLLLDEAARDPGLVARFRIEARAAGALSHENIAAVYDAGVHDGADFLVMDLLEGQDCASLLSSHGSLPSMRAVELAVQVCRGLARAHASGIVHRDLKPANLFVCARSDGSDLIKILDFGVAKLRTDLARSLALETGPALGTPHYMSPEQARGDELIDGRTDLYALGVVLYELLSGRRPIEPGTPLQVLHRVLTQTVPPLAELCPELPVGLSKLVARAMAKRREERFASAEELASALSSLPPARSVRQRARVVFDAALETAASARTSTGDGLGPSARAHVSAVAAPTQAGAPATARRRRLRRAAGLAVAALIVGALSVRGSSSWKPVAPSAAVRAPSRGEPKVVALPPVANSSHARRSARSDAEVADALPGTLSAPDASLLPLTESTHVHAAVLPARAPMAALPNVSRPFQPHPKLVPLRPKATEASVPEQPILVAAPPSNVSPPPPADAPPPSRPEAPRATRRLAIDHESPYQ